ncbi:major tail protein [Gordonia phage Daredevil]|uniref:Major tail protein n=1 Tax=Gordonia phage Daredevil TaxID=2283286 RepID=A0A345MIN0_9CAUD|nr:major tail protein [Gordonia phage Daredevil]AXH70411.1 major tail protein [Gordonia phage Daredevil]
MADNAAIMNAQNKLVRKMTAGAVLLGDLDTDIPDEFTTGALAEFTVPTGFSSLGLTSRDGSPTFTPETETSDVDSWGLLEPSRSDIIRRTTSVAWTSQETNKKVLGLYHNADLTAVTSDATTGETHVVDPTSPDIIYHRAIFVGIDGTGANAIYILKICPRFHITEVGEQQWGAENAVEYPFTGSAKVDEDLGYAVMTVFGGPGWKKIAVAAGFQAAP